MIAENVNLKVIVMPVFLSANLEQAVSKLRALVYKIIEVKKSGIKDALRSLFQVIRCSLSGLQILS